jgi:hypothetical protein
MTDGPRVRRIKSEKRNMPVEPAPAGMSRRRFLTFLGTGSAALAAGSAGLLPEPVGIPKRRAPRRASGRLAERIRAR